MDLTSASPSPPKKIDLSLRTPSPGPIALRTKLIKTSQKGIQPLKNSGSIMNIDIQSVKTNTRFDQVTKFDDN